VRLGAAHGEVERDASAPGALVQAPPRARIPPLIVALAIFALALNLRMGISSVGPVLPQVIRDLGTTVVFGSLLTTAPVIMMGIASPFSGRVAALFGIEWTIVIALVVVTLATLVRLWAGAPWLLLISAVVLGSGIAAGNTMLPAAVRSYFPERVALMTGVYTVGINIGAGSAALLTPQLAQGRDATWRGALSVWAVVAVLAGAFWLVVAMRVGRQPRRVSAAMPHRSGRAWLVALQFALQSMVYYGVLAWLAPLYEDRGWSKGQAGLLLSFFTAMQVVGAMSASLAVQRTGRLTAGLRITATISGIGLLLVALTPMSSPWLWTAVLGLGCGGVFPLSLTVPLAITSTVDDARRVTAFMLCYGYLLAATGPFAVSVLRSLSGGFALGFCFLAAVSAVMWPIARKVTGYSPLTTAKVST
jgi:CP family cyanate transporter-like MFS transporter